MTNIYRIALTFAALGAVVFSAGCGTNTDTAQAGAAGLANVAGASGSPGGSPGSNTFAGAAGTGYPAQAGAAALGVVVGDGKPFVPEGIQYFQSLDSTNAVLTVVAATVLFREIDGFWYWIVSARNDGPEPLCEPAMNTVVTANLAGAPVERPLVVHIQGPMYHSAGTFDSPCLMKGETGMGAAHLPFNKTDGMSIVNMQYQPIGYSDSAITKLPALTVGELKISGSSAGNVITGTLTNPSASSLAAPVEVTVFPLDSGGRPIDFGFAESAEPLAAGGSWTFTTTIRSPINKYAVFARYDHVE